MRAGVIVIRRLWWAHVLGLIITPVLITLAIALAWAGFQVLPKPDGWWAAPLLLIGSSVTGLVVAIAINSLFTYRVELDVRGLRIIGNLYTHDILWGEITAITKRHNFRIPGYHVGIAVDGSHLPQRHWSNLWLKGYVIHPLMDRGGIALTAYLKRKRRDYLKLQRAEVAVAQ
jgi:hypothetical protein